MSRHSNLDIRAYVHNGKTHVYNDSVVPFNIYKTHKFNNNIVDPHFTETKTLKCNCGAFINVYQTGTINAYGELNMFIDMYVGSDMICPYTEEDHLCHEIIT